MATNRLLLISSGDYDSSVAKGVVSMLDDFHEDGFFERVFIVFPLTRHNRRIPFSPHTEIVEMGVASTHRWVRRALAPFHIVRAALALAWLARREGVTVTRATDACFSGPLAWAVARLAHLPFCVSIHADFDLRHQLDPASGAPKLFGSRRLASGLEGFVLRRANRVWPIRESLRRYVLARGVTDAAVRIIPHGADLALFCEGGVETVLPPLPPQAAGRRLVSFVGRLSPENYVDEMLDVARRLGHLRRDFLLVIAGDGSESARVAAAVKQDDVLRDVVWFTGSLDRAHVAGLRRGSLACLGLMGGFSLIEAAAAGNALVSFDVEWHRELVSNGETGYLLREGDVEGVVAALAQLLDEPDEAVRMGAAARALAVARHDLPVAVKHKQSCYLDLLTALRQTREAQLRDAWDHDDQFLAQYSDDAGRELIEGRWAAFEAAIARWRAGREDAPVEIFDAGCGDGINLLGLQKIARRNGWPIILHGADRNMLRLERARRIPEVTFDQVSLTELPYHNGRFDVVLCNHVLEHIPDSAAALRELARVLRPGGLLMIGVPNEGCALAQLRNRVLQRSILRTTDHVHFFTRDSLAAALAGAGLTVREVMTESFFFPHMALNRLMNRRAATRRITLALGGAFPSQAAGLVAVATK